MTGRVVTFCTGDVNYNLAVEQAILEVHPTSPYVLTLRYWRNPQSVILGRGQDLQTEVQVDFCERHNIPICRRISGGGAVYQDKGNLNISFFLERKNLPISKTGQDLKIFFTKLLMHSMKAVGFNDIEREGLTNILYQGKKISGAAEFRKGGMVLHHATLLLSANLEYLNKSLKTRTRHPLNSMKSRFFPTRNIHSFKLNEWKRVLQKIVENHFNVKLKDAELLEKEKNHARQLKEKMYTENKWIREKERSLIS